MQPEGVTICHVACCSSGTKSSDVWCTGVLVVRQVKLYAGSFTTNEGFVWPEKKSACKFASFMFIFIPAI